MHTYISYTVKPTFEHDKEYEVSINWILRRNKFCIKVRKGSRKERLWIKEDVRIDEIMHKFAELQLPSPSTFEQHIVLDGTGCSLEIGYTPSVIYRWKTYLPEEWKPLREIIHLIEKFANDVAPFNDSKI